MIERETRSLAIATIVVALLIAASNPAQTVGLPLIGNYLYWLARLSVQAVFFVLVAGALERYFSAVSPNWSLSLGAAVISLVPFVLVITAFDIALGYPELGLQASSDLSQPRLNELGMEIIYLLDNHLIFCLMLSLVRAFVRNKPSVASPSVASSSVASPLAPVADIEPDQSNSPTKLVPSQPSFLLAIDPPLSGELLWAEAQEHYVRLKTSKETRMVLFRFSDVLRDLADSAGVQVHRSHWVAQSAVQDVFKEGPNLRLRLNSGDVVPVSRSYRTETERMFADPIRPPAEQSLD